MGCLHGHSWTQKEEEKLMRRVERDIFLYIEKDEFGEYGD